MGYEKPSTKLTFYKAFFSTQWKFFIHTILHSLSVERTSWNEFSSAMASALICLSSGERFNFSKVGKGFLGIVTPLFESMLAVRDVAEEAKAQVPAQDDDVQEPVAEEVATDAVPPTPTSPSPSYPRVLDTCSAFALRVEDLENDKAAQQLEIVKLKARAKIYHLDLDHSSKVLSMQEDDSKVQEVVEVITTAKLITDVVTASQVSATSTTISAAKPSIPVAAPTVVAAYTRRRKGVVIKNPEEELSSKTPTETPKLKDKGKGILIKTLKPMKKKDQIELDAEYAKKLHEEINKDIDWDAAIDHVNQKSKNPQYIKRYQRMKKRPQTKSEARKNMMIYLKNTSGYKMDFFKGMSYAEICPIFQARFDENMKFLFKSREEIEEEDQEIIKSINETPAQKAAKRRKLSEEAQEAEDLKKRLEVVDDEDDDVFLEATPLTRKVPVVNYQMVLIDNKPRFKIINADETHQLYINFTTLLKNFDREDLENLWGIVKKRFSTSKPTNFSDEYLLLTLKTMFEKPDGQDAVLTNQRSVHGLALLILLVERRYLLSRFTLEQLVNVTRLQVEEESKMSLELLRPLLYDGTVIAKKTNVISIANSEKTLILEEEGRSNMLLKQNFVKRFVPQQELSNEQAFQLQISHPNTDQTASSPVKIEAPRELPKTKPDALTEREWDMNTFVNVNYFVAMNDSMNYVKNCKKCLELKGRTFTLVGNACPLTRITATNKVPFREPIPLEVVAQESVVTKVYTWRPKETKLHTFSIRDMMVTSPICLLSKASKTKSWLWRRRLSHLNFGAINHLAKNGLVRGLPKLKFEKDHPCSASAMGKSKKESHKPKSKDINQEKLYLLHMDLCGHIRVASINGKKYILVIVDDYSRFTWVKFPASKYEVHDFIIKFLKMIQVRLNATIRNILIDNRNDFVNQTLRRYYEIVGVSHETLVAHTPQQNGVVERRNRTLLEAARTIKPDLSYHFVFGALCYPNNDSEDLGKLKAKADIVIFIGYAPKKKAYRIYNERTQKITETIHVDFDELMAMDFEQIGSGPGLQSMTLTTSSSGLVTNHNPQQPFNLPKRDNWDRLFQPMFDEYFNPPTIAVLLVLVAIAPRAIDLADLLVSMSIDQDALSISIPSIQDQEHSPIMSQGFEQSPKTPHFHDDPLHESLREDSTSQG
nr:retrovirus-related Pol polyprotein from transposon TNT 1-94 [Tanacetum cinerariifolium]